MVAGNSHTKPADECPTRLCHQLPGRRIDTHIGSAARSWRFGSTRRQRRYTTDWGALDAYHAPCRYPENNFMFNLPGEHTLDGVVAQ